MWTISCDLGDYVKQGRPFAKDVCSFSVEDYGMEGILMGWLVEGFPEEGFPCRIRVALGQWWQRHRGCVQTRAPSVDWKGYIRAKPRGERGKWACSVDSIWVRKASISKDRRLNTLSKGMTNPIWVWLGKVVNTAARIISHNLVTGAVDSGLYQFCTLETSF